MRMIAIIAIVAISALGWVVASQVRPAPAAQGEALASAPDTDKEAGRTSPPSQPSAPSADETPTEAAQSTPGPSPMAASADDEALLALLTAMSDKVDAIRDAVRDHDSTSVLRYQHDLLADVQRGRELASQDESALGRQVRGALDQLEGGLSGDLTKLDGASRGLHDVSQALAKARGISLAPRPRRVEDLQRFARDAAAKVANFQKGYDQGDPSRLMRLQLELLQMASDGQESLRNSHSPQAEQVKSALQDIQEALPDDPSRLSVAEEKLAAAAGIQATPGPTAQTAPSPAAGSAATSTVRAPSDLIPLVNGLGQSLDQVREAVASGAPDQASSARSALAEAVKEADSATANATFAEARRLRQALPLLTQVAQGNDQQIDAASNALGNVVGR